MKRAADAARWLFNPPAARRMMLVLAICWLVYIPTGQPYARRRVVDRTPLYEAASGVWKAGDRFNLLTPPYEGLIPTLFGLALIAFACRAPFYVADGFRAGRGASGAVGIEK